MRQYVVDLTGEERRKRHAAIRNSESGFERMRKAGILFRVDLGVLGWTNVQTAE